MHRRSAGITVLEILLAFVVLIVGLLPLIELMTTNKTDFFRESAHFDFLKKNLPELQAAKIARGDADFRIWCSATSTGQEPYSILMAYQEALRENERLPLRFLATDIDTRALLTARKGVYDPEQLRHIPPHSKTAWFSTIPTGRTTKYRVKAGLRNRIRFAPFNLVDANQYSFEGKFDVIFCRNVLIYFDEATVDKVIHNLLRFLNRDGFLILGLSEAIREIPPSVKLIGNSIYRKL